MKILYVAPTRDASGYGEAARGYIRALTYSGHDVAVHVVKFDGYQEDRSLDIQCLESKDQIDVDIVIQHVNPGLFNKYVPVGALANAKLNVGITTHETNSIPKSWVNECNNLDLIIVPCQDNRTAFSSSGVSTKIEVCPHVFDTSKYDIDYGKLEISGHEDELKFYSIFWHSYKKGLDKLIKAYYLAFQDNEHVSLTLRTYVDPLVPVENPAFFIEYISKIKEEIPMLVYPKIFLISHRLSEKEVMQLHQTCDVFVTATRGEGWCIPCFDAMGFNKHPIAAAWGGMRDYLSHKSSTPLAYDLVPCTNMGDNPVYSPKTKWADPLLSGLITAFKNNYCYQDDLLCLDGRKQAEKFSYKTSNLSETLKKAHLHETNNNN
jgi:hypothetical protein